MRAGAAALHLYRRRKRQRKLGNGDETALAHWRKAIVALADGWHRHQGRAGVGGANKRF